MTDTTRLRRAIEPILERCLDFFGVDDLDPESSEAMPVVIKNRWVYELRAALSEEAPAPLDVEAALMCGACFHPLHRGEPCGLSVRTRESVEGFCYCGISAALAPSSDTPERSA